MRLWRIYPQSISLYGTTKVVFLYTNPKTTNPQNRIVLGILLEREGLVVVATEGGVVGAAVTEACVMRVAIGREDGVDSVRYLLGITV
jgi:hypothetical protein